LEQRNELKAHANALAAALEKHHEMPGYSEALAAWKEYEK